MPHKKNHFGPVEANEYVEVIENHSRDLTVCCVPSGCCMSEKLIDLNQLGRAVKVVCNNDQCNQGQYMHKDCFEEWEQTVLTYLRSCGRARSWSEKQRLQNLWTKKGYDLAFKACGCKCGRGHIRKDLDWTPPRTPVVDAETTNVNLKKKKKKNKANKPALGVPAHGTNTYARVPENEPINRGRANSLGSTGSGGSPPSTGCSGSPVSPVHIIGKKKFDFFSDRIRHGSGNGGGVFSRRADFSSFNVLPRHKINSYHIKMEDEGSHGNDETRCFLLSNLAITRTTRIGCMLCHNALPVYDRYPLIDGTFFMSPRQYPKSCIQVKVDGRPQYLYAVCMGCLEGWNVSLRCYYCNKPWDGSNLILGTVYSYDIFAATPCCSERLKCSNCRQMVITPTQRLQYFSDYSHSCGCPSCGMADYHFVKSVKLSSRGAMDA